MELIGRGHVINRATTSSSNIRVDFYGRCGEGCDALPAGTICLDPAPAHAPATDHSPAPVHNNQPKEKLCTAEFLGNQLPPPPILQVKDFLIFPISSFDPYF